MSNIVLGLSNRIFGLDPQLLADVVILALAVGFLFFLMSYLLFNPARELLKKRQDKIKEETGATARVFAEGETAETCAVCGKKAEHMIIYARAY